MEKSEKANKKASVALSSVFASAAMTIGKLIVGLLTGSMGILSEAAHSLLDWGAAALTFFAVRIGDKPADDAHPYGHGKVESVSALIETGLLFLTSAWIVYEAVHRLLSGKTEVEITWYAFAVIIVSIIIDFTRSRALMKVAKETNSQALEADALHFKSDILSSCVVLIGLALSLVGVKGSDSFAAIGVSFFVLHAGWQLGKRTIDTLIDTAPLGIADKAREIITTIPGVIAADRIRARAFGAATFIDAEVTFDRTLPLTKTDQITTKIRRRIGEALPGADITIHAKSGQLADEKLVDTVMVLAATKNVAVHDVVIDHLDGKPYVSYHIEVPHTMSVMKAHAIADRFEQLLSKEVGTDVEIFSRIEPTVPDIVKSNKLSVKQAEEIIATISSIAKKSGLLLEPHDIVPRIVGKQLFITLHCLTADNRTIESAHHDVLRLEYLIKEHLPHARRVVIHIEPQSLGTDK